MAEKLDFSLIFCEFDEHLGPIPKISYPEINKDLALQIAQRTIDYITDEEFAAARSVAFLPFPTKYKKAIVRNFEWDDEQLRGGKGTASIVLLFDEVKTGFRLSLGGAQEYMDITPDLATFGKAIGGGFPVAAIAGKKHIMQIAEKARLAGTFNACPINMAAALATLTELEKGGKRMYAQFLDLGRELQKGIRDVIKDMRIDAIVQGSEVMWKIAFTELDEITNFQESKSLNSPLNKKRNDIFGREYVKRGIWGHPNHAWFLSLAHSKEDVENTIEAISESMKVVKSNVK